ncbi:MAG: aminoglycoside 6-adenylyltransferase [Acidimicrobiales bacterium]
MIEWDHRSRYGPDFHTWFLGKHLDQWIDAEVREALDRCWAAFPVSDARAALMATVELFDRLACRTGGSARVSSSRDRHAAKRSCPASRHHSSCGRMVLRS